MKNITVLGAGTMGLGIARLLASHGMEVNLYDPAIRTTEAANSLQTGYPLLEVSFTLGQAVAAAELIIEAVPEQLELKRTLFRELEALIQTQAIVASNTSSFTLHELSANLSFSDRMIITHFFNPPEVIPLVELVGSPSTSPHVLDQVASVLRVCGKVPVMLNKDVPGFIANRLQAALMREAIHLVESGVADVEQVDTVVREGLGLRWAFKGPFEIADLGGLDIWAKVTGHLFPELSGSSTAPESILDKVAHGELGTKTGRGFYEYNETSQTTSPMSENINQLVAYKKAKEAQEH
ncbi:3-hydroxyacyl-CoA dehydrogenase family protein [Paenibacillus koleovorans]|uniref:3-hydroxyacyl-CoA dehydrogenase family protein n=1 Tax=Paenibacillus koleovorans TaxID=121608 RepID=UPI000FDAA5FF|nr:3-hydroxyacyl-CoA dehydrogenase NAD-binding domain-containing protein [Paenibacillus koleovorans]